MAESFLDRFKVSIPSSVISDIEERVIPQIYDSADVAIEAYDLDKANNDGYTLGSYVWRNLYNRLLKSLRKGELIAKAEKSNDLTIEAKGLKFRVHKVADDTLLPQGGKAAKQAAIDLRLPLFTPEPHEVTPANLYIGYTLDSDIGVRKIFIANMVSAEQDSEKVYCVLLHVFEGLNDEQFVDSGANVIISDSFSEPKILVDRQKPREKEQEGESE